MHVTVAPDGAGLIEDKVGPVAPTSFAAWPVSVPIEAATDDTVEGRPLWAESIRARTNPALRYPRQATDVELFEMATPGDEHWVLRRTSTGRYLRLDSVDKFVWDQLDGAKRTLDVSKAFTAAFGQMGLFRVLAAVEMFDNAELLDEGPPDRVWVPLRMALHRRTLAGRLGAFNRMILFHRWPLSGLSGFFERMYQWGGRFFFVPAAVVSLLLVSIAGTVKWFGIEHPKPSSLSVGQLAVVAAGAILSLAFHEFGHAMAVRHFGRRVDRAGLMLMYGSPGAYVDTSDMWLATRRQRLCVTASGPIVNLVFGSVATFVALARPGTIIAAFAASQFLFVLANAMPLLKLDGYYMLMDATGVSNLRERSIGYIGKPFLKRLREAWDIGDIVPRLPRDERVIFLYGLAYTAWLLLVGIAGLLVLPIRLWRTGADAIAIGTKNVLGAFLAFCVVSIMAFGVLQLFAARSKIAELITMVGRRVDRSTRLGGLAVAAALIAVFGGLLPELAATRSAAAHTMWAGGLPAVACAQAAWRSWQTAIGARGSHWRLVFGCCAVGSGLLGVAEVCALSDIPFVSSLRVVAVVVVGAGFVTGRKMSMGALGGSLVACWLPVLLGLVMLTIPGGPAHVGALSVGCGLVVGARILRRPFTDRRRLADIPTTEPLRGPREGTHLRRGFENLMEHLALQISELFGEAQRISFITAANTAAVDGGWPLWFVQSGQLVDRIDAPLVERAAIYRNALLRFVEVAGSMSDPAVATEAVVEARLLLPNRLGSLIDQHLGSSLATVGRSSLTPDLDDSVAATRFTVRHLVRTLSRCVEETVGRSALERIVSTVNRRSSRHGWGLWCRANGQVGDDALTVGVVPEEVASHFLAVMCSATAEALGASVTRASVQFALDTLARELHPAADRLLLDSPWNVGPRPKTIRTTTPSNWPIPV